VLAADQAGERGLPEGDREDDGDENGRYVERLRQDQLWSTKRRRRMGFAAPLFSFFKDGKSTAEEELPQEDQPKDIHPFSKQKTCSFILQQLSQK